MLNKTEVREAVLATGNQCSLDRLYKAVQKCTTIEEAVAFITAPQKPKYSGDCMAYMQYNTLVDRAERYSRLRASVGDSSSAEDIGYTKEVADREIRAYDAHIAECRKQAEQYREAAERWARSGREKLREFPSVWF